MIVLERDTWREMLNYSERDTELHYKIEKYFLRLVIINALIIL